MVMQQTISPARFSLNRSLEAQRVVTIGGTSGFGMTTAKAASAEGASVVVASSKKTNVDRALAGLPDGTEDHVLDITQESAVTDFFSTIGEFDHLAVTAGKSSDLGEFAAADLEKARRFFEVHFWGAVTATKHAAKRIKSNSIALTNAFLSASRKSLPEINDAPGPSVGHCCLSSRAFPILGGRTHLHRCWYKFVPFILSTVSSLVDSSAFRYVSLGQEIDVVFTSQALLVFRCTAE